MTNGKARSGMRRLEQAVLAVLRDAAPCYLWPGHISERTGIFGESLKIDGKEKVTSHAIVNGILAKLYSDGLLEYKYRVGWRLKTDQMEKQSNTVSPLRRCISRVLGLIRWAFGD